MNINYDHQIFSNQNLGGPSRYFVELIKELISLKNRPVVIAPFNQNIYLAEISSKFKKEFFFKIGKKNFLTQKINDLVSNYIFGKNNYDLYHLTYYNKCFNTKKPKIITVYDLIHEKFMHEFDFKSLPKKKVFENIDHFFCISNNTKNDLINYYNVNESKVSTIYPGVEQILLEKNNSAINNNFLSLKPYILYVGSRHGYKNAQNFLISFSKSKKLKDNIKIVFFGGGKFSSKEKKLLNNLNLNEKNCVQIDGDDSLLKFFYKNAEVFIYPSLYEGFGSSPLEAMKYGCPVASSITSCMPEIQGDASKKFDPNNIENIISVLEEIIYSNEIRKDLINKGYERVKKYSWKKCALETLQVYKNLKNYF